MRHCLVLLFAFSVFLHEKAQGQAITVQILSEKPLQGQVICLRGYMDGRFVTLDSAEVTVENKGVLTFDTKNYTGTCELNVLHRAQPGTEFILNPSEEDLKLIGTLQDVMNGNMEILNSTENTLYAQLKVSRNLFEKRLSALLKAKKELSPLQHDYFSAYQAFDTRIEEIKDSINTECEKITKDHSYLFVAQITKNLIKLPTRSNLPDGNKYDTQDAFLSEHFFDFLDFSNPLLIHHYAFSFLLEQYFSQYTSTKDKFLFRSCDMLMKKAQSNGEVKNFMYNFLLGYGITRNMDYMVDYMQTNFGDECDLGVGLNNTKTLEAMNNTKIGAIVPDILLYDLDGQPQSLTQYVKKNKLTVLVFWIGWCVHCQQELPALAKLQASWKKRKIGLFTVGLDEDKTTWKMNLEKYGLKGIHVNELVPLAQSKVLPVFNIHTTPALFILDSEGKILEKNVFGKSLEKVLEIK